MSGRKAWCRGRGEAGGVRVVRSGLRGSGCWSVFVDQPVTGGGSSDLLVEFDHGRVALIVGCSLAETAMGPVLVVVGHELLKEPTQVGVGPERPAGVSADGFLRPALRTGRATFTASGSPPDPSF